MISGNEEQSSEHAGHVATHDHAHGSSFVSNDLGWAQLISSDIVISQAKFKAKSIIVMALFFALTTPIGVAIGIGITSKYDENSSIALIVEGILNAASSGILIYMSLVDLLATDFMSERMQNNGKLQLGAYVSLLIGAGFHTFSIIPPNKLIQTYNQHQLKVRHKLLIEASHLDFPSWVSAECTCDPEEDGKRDRKTALRLKIGALASILVFSAIGVSLPVLAKSIPAFKPENDFFYLIKSFAAGVILATGFIHILPDAFENLTSPCLKDNPWGSLLLPVLLR
ncbi:hypothetical protein Syun_010522 [Stephania yunnanensis]|uniref:Uncharacterized protein n=1 Tax=Stephania yunnanensis TaxID=152371 RepID=A0AAP0PPQ0_9MAGN